MKKLIALILAVALTVVLFGCAPVEKQNGEGESNTTNTTGNTDTTNPQGGNTNEPQDTTPGETTPGETTPGETTPGETIPGETTPGETTPGQTPPDDHTHVYEVSGTVAASCTKEGSTTYTCKCGDSYSKPIPMASHEWGDWYTSKPASKTEKGERRQDCVNCDAYNTEPIDKLPIPTVSEDETYACLDASINTEEGIYEDWDAGTFRFQHLWLITENASAEYAVAKVEVLGAEVEGQACTVYQTTSKAKAEEIGIAYDLEFTMDDFGWTVEEAKEYCGIKDYEVAFIIISPVLEETDYDNPYIVYVTLKVTFENGAVTTVDYWGEAGHWNAGPAMEQLTPELLA